MWLSKHYTKIACYVVVVAFLFVGWKSFSLISFLYSFFACSSVWVCLDVELCCRSSVFFCRFTLSFFLSQLCHWLNDLRLCICCTSDGCSFLLLFAFFFIFFAFVFIHFRYIHVRIHMFCTGMQDIGFGRWVNECSALYMYVEYKLGTLLSHILYLFARSIARCALCGIAPNRLYV